jgi:hypothetical protein
MTSRTRITRRALARNLEDTWILADGPRAIDDPNAFLRDQLGLDATVVVESTDRVRTEHVRSVTLDAQCTIHAHGFSSSRQCQARVARTPNGWIGDAVRECGASTPGARQVMASDGRMMCLGERVEADSGGTTYAEARIKPYILPMPDGPRQVDVAFRNYYQETASGRLACVAHRVTGFVARGEK